jgi:hypothetical protein
MTETNIISLIANKNELLKKTKKQIIFIDDTTLNYLLNSNFYRLPTKHLIKNNTIIIKSEKFNLIETEKTTISPLIKEITINQYFSLFHIKTKTDFEKHTCFIYNNDKILENPNFKNKIKIVYP